jgi:hypothetical protein
MDSSLSRARRGALGDADEVDENGDNADDRAMARTLPLLIDGEMMEARLLTNQRSPLRLRIRCPSRSPPPAGMGRRRFFINGGGDADADGESGDSDGSLFQDGDPRRLTTRTMLLQRRRKGRGPAITTSTSFLATPPVSPLVPPKIGSRVANRVSPARCPPPTAPRLRPTTTTTHLHPSGGKKPSLLPLPPKGSLFASPEGGGKEEQQQEEGGEAGPDAWWWHRHDDDGRNDHTGGFDKDHHHLLRLRRRRPSSQLERHMTAARASRFTHAMRRQRGWISAVAGSNEARRLCMAAAEAEKIRSAAEEAAAQQRWRRSMQPGSPTRRPVAFVFDGASSYGSSSSSSAGSNNYYYQPWPLLSTTAPREVGSSRYPGRYQ